MGKDGSNGVDAKRVIMRQGLHMCLGNASFAGREFGGIAESPCVSSEEQEHVLGGNIVLLIRLRLL